MSAPASLRKGWCPGALRPMAARDGLLVRLKLTGGTVPAALAHALADLAERHGNGLFDLSARANLQMRGVSEASYPALRDALDCLGVLDGDPEAEAVRNVLASPLAGLHNGVDLRPVVAALERRLARDPGLKALPGKFGFLVDDGSLPGLDDVSADVRFEWCEPARKFAIALGGTRGTALPIGDCDAEDLLARGAAAAHGFLALGSLHPEARRMTTLRDRAGDRAVAEACGGRAMFSHQPPARHHPAVVGMCVLSGVSVLGLAAPFGRLDAAMLRIAADRTAGGELRLTPWRTILLPHVPLDGAAGERADLSGWIVDATDPRLRIAACTGQAGCAMGTTPTHADAAALADLWGAVGSGTLHVSGCRKGCARPASGPVTLVGREGRYDLVCDGSAADPPARRELSLAECRAELAALAAVAVS